MRPREVPMRAAFLCLPVLALSACAGAVGGLVYNTDFQPQFSGPGQVPLGGVQPVFLLGTPPAGLTGEGFVSLLRVPGWYQPTAFRLAGPGDERGFRFVAAFGTDLNAFLCERPQAGGDPRLVAMALCLGDTTVSRASLRLDPGGDVAAQVRGLMVGLLPPRRPDDSGPCLRRGGC